MAKKYNLRAKLATAVLISIASILHVVEGMVPPLPIPGAKLGLANIASLIGLRTLDFGSAVVISLARCFIGSLFGSGLFGPTFYLSLAGSLSSALMMGLASKIKGIGNNNVFVSVVG
ncbi:MAG: Gx transporter family protein, partial [Bacillota bacterium]